MRVCLCPHYRPEAEAFRGLESSGHDPVHDVPVPLDHVRRQSVSDLHVLHPGHPRGASLPPDCRHPGEYRAGDGVRRVRHQPLHGPPPAAQQPQQAVREAAAVDRQVVQISAR